MNVPGEFRWVREKLMSLLRDKRLGIYNSEGYYEKVIPLVDAIT